MTEVCHLHLLGECLELASQLRLSCLLLGKGLAGLLSLPPYRGATVHGLDQVCCPTLWVLLECLLQSLDESGISRSPRNAFWPARVGQWLKVRSHGVATMVDNGEEFVWEVRNVRGRGTVVVAMDGRNV